MVAHVIKEITVRYEGAMMSQALSPALEKKRAKKEERLQSHLQTYLNDSSARRSLVAASSDPNESVDGFLASFSQCRDQVLAIPVVLRCVYFYFYFYFKICLVAAVVFSFRRVVIDFSI